MKAIFGSNTALRKREIDGVITDGEGMVFKKDILDAWFNKPRIAPPQTINHNRMIVFETTILGAYNYGPDGFAGALELLADPTFPADHLIETDEVGLGQIESTMHALAAGSIAGKVLVNPERS